VTLNNQITAKVTVYLDGAQIAGRIVSEVEAKIAGAMSFITGAAMHNDHAAYASPDGWRPLIGPGHRVRMSLTAERHIERNPHVETKR
jgi:hypothetical protein